jgi:hypothetical protein
VERHQTLRHAVAWSYELLDDAEKRLLEACSVFAGGFDLKSACAVAGYDGVDDYVVLDLLGALVRKSLLTVDRSTEYSRFSMLETIRQFAEEQLAAGGEADTVRSTHARYFAGRESDILTLWDSPRQREAYAWFTSELPNLRSAFRWAVEHDDLDVAIDIALCAHFLGIWVVQYEPVAWVEELIDAARELSHRRLPQLYVAAAQCYATGRIGDAVAYLECSEKLIGIGEFDPPPFETQTSTGIVYGVAGQPERWAELCRSVIANHDGPLTITRACLVMALYFLGNGDDARVESAGLLAAAEATDNPTTAVFALMSYGGAYIDADPVVAYESDVRALKLARETGNRQLESAVAVMLCALLANQGEFVLGGSESDSIDAFDYLTVTIRRHHDAGSVSLLSNPLALLAGVFERLGNHEQAATICGFADSAMARASYPAITTMIARLREVLGDQTYDSLARTGETMTATAMVTYAFDEIDQARTELNAVSE